MPNHAMNISYACARAPKSDTSAIDKGKTWASLSHAKARAIRTGTRGAVGSDAATCASERGAPRRQQARSTYPTRILALSLVHVSMRAGARKTHARQIVEG